MKSPACTRPWMSNNTRAPSRPHAPAILAAMPVCTSSRHSMPKPISGLSLVLLIAMLLAGCAGQRFDPQQPIAHERLGNPTWVKQVLYAQYSEWKAVKYRGGGLSKAGVDCSGFVRSEEHTSELQSRENLVCRLLLEKKKVYN